MADARTERNLARLEASASTARVMNLAVSERSIASEPLAPRIFSGLQLNRSIILKHTIRPHEREMFARPRRVATKIIIPYDFRDLKLGGKSIFFGQRDLDKDEDLLSRVTGATKKDLSILRILDDLPSLDPFLVKEHTARANISIPAERLNLSPADILSMRSFVQDEIRGLLSAAMGGMNISVAERFAEKILTDTPDDSMEPLMQTMRLNKNEFWNGIFSWRGFLYYKWRLLGMQEGLDKLKRGTSFYIPSGSIDQALSQYISQARPRVLAKIDSTIMETMRIMEVYDDAFNAMVNFQEPTKFKNFLLNGPYMFLSLGEQVGLLDHFTSLWNYRDQIGAGRMTGFEYADFLIDLDESISATQRVEREPRVNR